MAKQSAVQSEIETRRAQLQLDSEALKLAIAAEIDAIAERKACQFEYDKSVSAFDAAYAEIIAGTAVTFNG